MKNQNIRIEQTETKKHKPSVDQLEFGKYFTDHMFIMDYEKGKGWYDPRIVPYQPVILDPAAVDRKSTRLNSSHVAISYAVFCLKKKKKTTNTTIEYRTR